MSSAAPRTATWVVGTAAVVLGLLHQDLWFWNDRTLVLGVLPIGLAYHALFSLAAAGLWALAVRFAWPRHIEQWADEHDAPAGGEDAP
ncbi:MAG: DUF3311 domain-containing protein [Planctomycetota bacterium]|jgi:hypothetical protein